MRQKVFVITMLALLISSGLVFYRGATLRSPIVPPDSLSIGPVWPEPRPITEFALHDHKEKLFGPDQLRGQWTLVFFGYTSCPDICPTTMLTLRSVVSKLAESGVTSPRVVLVSVDPERDDLETLGKYVTHFGEDFLGVRGDEGELIALTLQFGAMYEREPPDQYGGYDMGHSASIFLVDPQARIHAVFSPPHQANAIAKRLVTITQVYESG